MDAAAWTAERTITVESRPGTEPKPGEVAVHIAAAGICGTDLHFLRDFPPPVGTTPGHEIAGVVVGGEGFAAGTPVAIDPMLSCLECDACRSAQSPICQRSKLIRVSAH